MYSNTKLGTLFCAQLSFSPTFAHIQLLQTTSDLGALKFK
jgi:hypothetical protein